MEHLFLMFLDHTQRRTTVGRTPLDEWSALRRDLYLTTHDTHNTQISMPLVGFEPTISTGERPQAAHLLRSWVRIPPGAWIFVCCECRVLSGRGLCEELSVKIHNETRKRTTQKPVEREKCTSFLPAIVQGPLIYCTRTRTNDLLWLVDVWSCKNSRNCQHCAPGDFLKFAPSVRIIILAAAIPFPEYLSDNISNLVMQVSHGPTSPLHTLSQNQL